MAEPGIKPSEANDDFLATATNDAGGQFLPGNGKFREIVTINDDYLLISETDCWLARYIGAPFIYSFEKVVDNCGVTAAGAVVVSDGIAMWPSERDFFIYDGQLKRLECHVMDDFQANENKANRTKTTAFINAEWQEAMFLYQSAGDDVDSYIAFDWKENHWQKGTLARSVGGGHPSLLGPIMIGTDGYAYQHEIAGTIPQDSDPSEVFIESGPITIGQGNNVAYVNYIMPDLEGDGSVDVTIIGQDKPNGPETEFGPYRVSCNPTDRQPFPVRARGHTIRVRIETVDSPWILGSFRISVFGGGRK